MPCAWFNFLSEPLCYCPLAVFVSQPSKNNTMFLVSSAHPPLRQVSRPPLPHSICIIGPFRVFPHVVVLLNILTQPSIPNSSKPLFLLLLSFSGPRNSSVRVVHTGLSTTTLFCTAIRRGRRGRRIRRGRHPPRTEKLPPEQADRFRTIRWPNLQISLPYHKLVTHKQGTCS